MFGLTSKQWFQIVSASIGSLITGAALLQTLFGQDLTLKIVAVLGIFNIVLSSVGAALSGQASLVRDVAAMPGVERINVNASANQTLASVAVDPDQKKVGAANPTIMHVLADTAKGA